MRANKVSIRVLRQWFDCDPETGIILWKNKSFAGRRGFSSLGNRGYFCGRFHEVSLLAHRVIWALHYGKWPKEQIDHINGIRTDNRINNLREVCHSENGKNVRLHRNNTSGTCGVHWVRRDNIWISRIKVNRRIIFLGHFSIKSEAVAARKAAEIEYGFHPNHGRIGPSYPMTNPAPVQPLQGELL